MTGAVVHFEVPADDVERAQKFYSKTFGWKMQSIPEMGYTLVLSSPSNAEGRPTNPGTINGGMLRRQAPVEHCVITIGVEDIDASLKAVAKNGGKVVEKKMPVGDMGFAAYFRDSEGNVIGLWEASRP
jgi:uncharacterized protein